VRALGLLLLLGAVAAAQDLPYTRDAVALMPGLEAAQRNALYRLQGAAAQELARTQKSLREIDKQLAAKPAADARKALVAEQKKLQARLPAVSRELEEKTLAAGINGEQLARLRAMPQGALREERYNHGVVLEAPGLSEEQAALLVPLVAATDAAQAAALAQQQHLVQGLDEVDKTLRRRIDATCGQQRREIERRFWRAAYYALTPEQMRATRALLSPRYSGLPELQRQLYLLPELSPSQANRLTALFNEMDSECAADRAELLRLKRLRKEKKLPKKEGLVLDREARAAAARIEERERALHDGLRAVLTPAQRDALDGLPPVLNLGERGRPPWELANDMRLQPAQRTGIAALRKDAGEEARDIRKEQRAEEQDLMAAGIGAESPQAMTMTMARQGAQGATMEVYRGLGLRLVTAILTPEQVAAWVVAPSLQP